MITPLSKIANGSMVEVKEVLASQLRVKLFEMGIINGKRLRVLFRAPLGDPIAIDLDGCVLALRKDEASLIQVESIENA